MVWIAKRSTVFDLWIPVCCIVTSSVDVGHGEAAAGGQDQPDGPQGLQDDATLLRHLLQPGEIPGARAEGPLC